VKLIRYLFLVTLLITLLAACGGDDDDGDDPTATTGTTATEVTDSDTTPTEADEPDATEADGDATEPDDSAAATATGTTAPSGDEEETPTPRWTPTPEVTFEDDFALGWNVGMRGDPDGDDHNRRVAEVVNESGAHWVRFQIPWFQIEPEDDAWEPERFDRMIGAMSEAGVNVLGVVAKAPDWAVSPEPQTFLNDPAELQELMAYLADRYKGQVQAWEIWNEQNLAFEVGGYVNVDDYIAMLRAGSEGVRSADPDALVVFGGLTPNGLNDPAVAIDDFNYLNLAYARSGGELAQWFDVLGVHANSTHNSPDETWPDNITSGHEGWNDHPSFFFRRTEALRQVMVDQGDLDKPVWITEFGWTTENPAPGYEYGVNNSEEEVAEFLYRALEICHAEWTWCTGAFVWNLNWSTLVDDQGEKGPWSALNADWSPRPQFEAVQEFARSLSQ